VFIQRVSFFALPGKATEIRAILEERTRERQAKGVRTSLSVTAFGPEPHTNLAFAFDDLGALEEYRASELGQADPRVGPLIRANRSELLEMLLQGPPASTPARFSQRVTLMPALGKGRDVQQLVLDMAKTRHAEGVRQSVTLQVAGAAAGSVGVTIAFGSALEFEKVRARNQADSAFQAFVQRLAPCLAHSSTVELFSIVVPFQPRQ
jgi:hypothetical protein